MYKFDKEQYRARRDRGMRGQDNLAAAVKPNIALFTEEDHKKGLCGSAQVGKPRTSGVTMHATKKGMIAITRRMKRRKQVDRDFTSRGHAFGVKIGSKVYNLFQHRKHKINRELIAPRHIKNMVIDAERREKNNQLAISNGYRFGETNKQRFERHKEARNAARSTTPATA